MSKDKEKEKEDNKRYGEVAMRNWRAWGSWFSWGSPVGLGIFFVLSSMAIWILASIAKFIGE